MQIQAGVGVSTALKDALLQEGFHLRIERDRFIKHRITARGISTDAAQIAVTLEAGEQLLKLAHSRIVVLIDQRGHRTADRGFYINGRIVTRFAQPTRQHNVAVENGARGVGDRVLLIVAFGQDGLEGGD